jgi:hypothetical protein
VACMKRPILVVAALALATARALGLWFPSHVKEYRPPPPLTVDEAYAFAATAVRATSTNHFRCIRTNTLSCLNPGDWCFVFRSTNGHSKAVCVMVNDNCNLAEEQRAEPTMHTVVFDDLDKEQDEAE